MSELDQLDNSAPQRQSGRSAWGDIKFISAKKGFGFGIGWKDRSEELAAGSGPEGNLTKGKIYLRNGNLVRAFNELGTAAADGTFSRKSEAVNLREEVIRPLLTWEVYLGYENKDISSTRYFPAFIDRDNSYVDLDGNTVSMPEDGVRQPWENIQYNANGDPIFVPEVRQQRAETYTGSFNTRQLYVANRLVFQAGLEIKKTDFYDGSDDVKFNFYPYVNEYTSKDIADLFGEEKHGADFGTIKTISPHVNIALLTYPVPVLRNLINRVQIGYQPNITSMDIDIFPQYEYNDFKKDIEPVDESTRDDLSFTKTRHDLSVGGETQTFSLLFNWPYTFYATGFYGYQYSIADKGSMPDIYYPSDENYYASDYYMDRQLTDEEVSTVQNDARAFAIARRKLAESRPLDAHKVQIGYRGSIPGVMQWFKLLGLADLRAFENGSAEGINFTHSFTWNINDNLMNTSDGMYPSTVDVWAPWEKKYVNGDDNNNGVQDPGETWETDVTGNYVYKITKSGKDYHKLADPYNAYSWQLGISHNLRLGQLSQLSSKGQWWKGAYWGETKGGKASTILSWIASFGGAGLIMVSALDSKKYENLGYSALCLAPTLLAPATSFLIGLVDKGTPESQIKLGMPVEFSWGRSYYDVKDINTGEVSHKEGWNNTMGIGLSFNEVATAMVRRTRSDNGNGYKSDTWSYSLQIKLKYGIGAVPEGTEGDEGAEERKNEGTTIKVVTPPVVKPDTTSVDEQKKLDETRKKLEDAKKKLDQAIKDAQKKIDSSFKTASSKFQQTYKIDPLKQADYAAALKKKMDEFKSRAANVNIASAEELQAAKDKVSAIFGEAEAYTINKFASDYMQYTAQLKGPVTIMTNRPTVNTQEARTKYNAVISMARTDIENMFKAKIAEFESKNKIDPAKKNDYLKKLKEVKDSYLKRLDDLAKKPVNLIDEGAVQGPVKDARNFIASSFDSTFKVYVQAAAAATGPDATDAFKQQKLGEIDKAFTDRMDAYMKNKKMNDAKKAEFRKSATFKGYLSHKNKIAGQITAAKKESEANDIVTKYKAYIQSTCTDQGIDDDLAITN